MATIAVRSTVCGVMEESTEGVPVVPAAATDYIKLQAGFSMAPAFDVLENQELSGTIGRAKSILGGENPTTTLSHYLRGSGTAGTAPNYGKLIKASLGAVDTEASEYDVAATGTVSVINVGSGEGATIRRGQAILAQHSTNAWELRPVESVSTDAVTVAFDFENAPATGTLLGRSTTYYPTNDSHPSICLFNYLGNGGGLEVLGGGRNVGWTITANAGELINIDFNIEGTWFGFNPILIASDSKYLDWTDDDGTFAVAIEEGWYKSPQAVADALNAAIEASSTTETIEVTYSSTTGKFTIATSTSTVLSLLWNDGTNAANSIATKIGFATAANDTSATTYTSDNAQTYSAAHTPSYDDASPLAAKNMQVFVGDSTDNACFNISSFSVQCNTPKAIKGDVCEESGRGGSTIIDREVLVNFTAYAQKYETDKFNRFATNQDTRFAVMFGEKSGGNWVKTKCGTVYVPKGTIVSWELTDVDGTFVLNAQIRAYDDGNGDIFLSTC